MIRKSSIATALLLLVVALGCAVTQNTQDTPLQTAEKQYVAASVAYEAAQNVIVEARRNHQITDAQWKIFDEVQTTVITEAPIVRNMINLWRATGNKPTGVDDALALLQGAATAAVNLQNGVKP